MKISYYLIFGSLLLWGGIMAILSNNDILNLVGYLLVGGSYGWAWRT